MLFYPSNAICAKESKLLSGDIKRSILEQNISVFLGNHLEEFFRNNMQTLLGLRNCSIGEQQCWLDLIELGGVREKRSGASSCVSSGRQYWLLSEGVRNMCVFQFHSLRYKQVMGRNFAKSQGALIPWGSEERILDNPEIRFWRLHDLDKKSQSSYL